MMMLIILPIIFWLAVFFIFIKYSENEVILTNVREAFIWATIIYGVSTVFIIEGLGYFHLMTTFYLGAAWLVALVVAGSSWFYLKIPTKIIRILKVDLSYMDKILLGLIIIIIGLTALTAIIAPPNNYDAMTYHLARVAHWEQNRSVAHYPTHILRQLSMSPGAEYHTLNFAVLSGNDHFANLVQWFSMVGSLIIISLIARSLGADHRVQIFSAFIGATIPMGIMQSTSAQNDYAVAFWLLGFAYFIIKLEKGSPLLNVLPASAALGLAWLTKATAYFFSAPFILWLMVVLYKREKINAWKYVLVVAVMPLLINSAFYLRNYQLFGSPLGPHDNNIPNEIHSLWSSSLNVVKYISQNINTPSAAVNGYIYGGVNKLHEIMRVNLNDRRTSAFAAFTVEAYAPHEDLIGNPLHLLLIFVCSLLLIFKPKVKDDATYAYVASLVGSVLVFFALVKYQPWLNRLLFPVVVMFSPFIGIMAKKHFPRYLLITFLVLLFLADLPPLLMNIKKPWVTPFFAPAKYHYSLSDHSREYFYFAAKPETYHCYKKLSIMIRQHKYDKIGLIGIDNEYPLWAMLKNDQKPVRLEHIEVGNVSRMIAREFVPNAVIDFGSATDRGKRLKTNYKHQVTIGRDSSGGLITLYGK